MGIYVERRGSFQLGRNPNYCRTQSRPDRGPGTLAPSVPGSRVRGTGNGLSAMTMDNSSFVSFFNLFFYTALKSRNINFEDVNLKAY